MMIKKVVIPAAGSGTRLLPATKETPKEMLPIFSRGNNSKIIVKPLLQSIFEQLYDVRVREFCVIVGKGKASIINHFTVDGSYLQSLNGSGRQDIAGELSDFYDKLNRSSFVFVSQPEPKGFGDAVLKAEPYINEPFMVYAGDSLILSEGNQHLERLFKVHEEYGSDATFIVQYVEDPRPFGVIDGQEVERGIYRVTSVIEKPSEPPSNLAITAVYVFSPKIFNALKSVSRGAEGELQVTDGIKRLIDDGFKVLAVELEEDEYWLDIGKPGPYWEALRQSWMLASKGLEG